jgi:hypothetical protein
VEGPLPVERESDSKLVSEILDKIRPGFIRAGEPICICIPMKSARDDVWTNLLVRILRSKDAEGRGARVMASEALEGYLAGGRGGQEGTVKYGICSFIVPRLTEVVITLVLTFWFRVDGFSSSLVARRTIRDFLVDTKGTGFAANAFLTKAVVQADNNNTQVCQILRFRGNRVGIRSLSFIVGCVDLISSLGWAVLIAFEGGADSSPPPSMPIVAVIIVAIGTALVMDAGAWMYSVCVDEAWLDTAASVLIIVTSIAFSPVVTPMLWLYFMWRKHNYSGELMIMTAISLETAWIVIGSTVAGTLGMKVFGRWIYGAFQILVWVKWATGSYVLNHGISSEFFGRIPEERLALPYSFAFLLNAVLAGVRCKWEAWPWKDNHLFSRKLGP